MKYFALLSMIAFFILILPSCEKKNSKSKSENKPFNHIILTDSLKTLDSLVNANKISDGQSAKKFASQSLSLALRSNSEDALAQAFLIMGIAYSNNNSDSSFIYFSKALKIAQNINIDRIKTKAIYNLAMIYLYASDQKTALIFLDSAISVSRRVKDFVMLSNAFNTIGNLKLDIMDTLDSKAMYDSAFQIATMYNIPKQMGIAVASLSRFEKGFVDSEKMRKKAVEILQVQPGNEEEIATILNNIGMRNPNPDTAIWYYESAIKIAKKGNCMEVEIAAYNNLAYSLIDKKEIQKAEDCLSKFAIPLAERLDNYNLLSNLYDSYCDVMISAGKTNLALSYERKSLNMRIKADQRQASNQVRLLAALLNVKNKELRIQNNEKELKEKEYKIRLIFFLLSLSLLLLIITVVLYNLKMQKNKLKFHKSLFTSAKKLIDIEENMKGRVAMELHDLTTPFYTVMLQQIEKAQISDTRIVRKLKDRLSTMTESIREISHRMDNNFIGQLSINELIHGLCNDLQPATSVPIRCSIHRMSLELTSEQTIHIYRIIQELLTNAIKYVKKGEIRLSVSEEAGMFIVLYKDTGMGFEDNTFKGKGLGITNIFERARILNGKAVLTTFPEQGTNWNIAIPINHNT
jgi:signal transduction histidine kinase